MQDLSGLGYLAFFPHDAYVYFRALQIISRDDMGNGDKTEGAIVQFLLDDRRDLFFEQLIDSLYSVGHDGFSAPKSINPTRIDLPHPYKGRV